MFTFNSSFIVIECGPNEFHCYNGKCIDKRLVCNGDDDCGDNEDDFRDDDEDHCGDVFKKNMIPI